MRVVQNTYQEYFNVPHAKADDLVHWEHNKCFNLVRDSDDKIVYFTGPVDHNGLLRSTGKAPILTGIISEVRCEGWFFEIA